MLLNELSTIDSKKNNEIKTNIEYRINKVYNGGKIRCTSKQHKMPFICKVKSVFSVASFRKIIDIGINLLGVIFLWRNVFNEKLMNQPLYRLHDACTMNTKRGILEAG